MIVTSGTAESARCPKFTDFIFSEFFVFGEWVFPGHDLCPNNNYTGSVCSFDLWLMIHIPTKKTNNS